jgi:hypothetical protein
LRSLQATLSGRIGLPLEFAVPDALFQLAPPVWARPATYFLIRAGGAHGLALLRRQRAHQASSNSRAGQAERPRSTALQIGAIMSSFSAIWSHFI